MKNRSAGPNRLRSLRELRRVSPKPQAKAEGPALRSRTWLLSLAVCGAVFVLSILPAAEAQPRATAPATRLEMMAGSKAEYRVREQLARLNFPNDAIGTTGLSGSLVIGGDGSFPAGSKLTVGLRALKSDEDRRDAWLRENTLHTDRFPLAQFVPRRQQGLPAPLPATGKVTFQLVGDMTLHGVTSELSWNVVANLAPDLVTGEATTDFPFAKFGLTIPKLMGLISVNDDIRLVLNFRARRTSGT